MEHEGSAWHHSGLHKKSWKQYKKNFEILKYHEKLQISPGRQEKWLTIFIQCKLFKINFLHNNLAVTELCSLLSTFFSPANLFLSIQKIISRVPACKYGWEYWSRLSLCYFKSLRPQCTLFSNTPNLYSSHSVKKPHLTSTQKQPKLQFCIF